MDYKKVICNQPIPKDEYDLSCIEEVTTKRFGFNLFSTPGYSSKYTDIVFEEMSALFVRQILKGIGAFIDVGAHYGFYCVLAGLSNPQANIIAFEPVVENFEILNMNLKLNNIAAVTHNIALSNEAGRFKFQISEQSSQSGLIANPDEKVIKTIDVEVRTLDSYLRDIPLGSVMVKIDTEGNESKVLEGMNELIKICEDLRLLIEFNPKCLITNQISPQDFLNHIYSLGFDIYVICDVEKRIIKHDHRHSGWHEIMGERTYRNLYCIKKDKSMNLCFFSHSSYLYGSERSLLELTRNLISNRGAVCSVVLPNEGPLKNRLEDIGVTTLICNYDWWCASSLLSCEKINLLLQDSYEKMLLTCQDIENIKPDVIITNTIVIPWGAITALNFGLPHMWWIHEYGELDHGFKFYFSFKETLNIIREASNFIVVNSNAVKDALFKDLENTECTVAYNNVTLEDKDEAIKPIFTYPSSLKLLITGSVIKSKGQDDAVHAMKMLLDEGHDIELCLIGNTESPFCYKLKDFVREEKFEDRIHFYGFVENVHQVIRQADIGLTCSRNEAFGRCTVEAMLTGKPVIGTSAGGTIELIDDGNNGFLYVPGDVNQLVEKIKFFVNYPEKIHEFGERARKRISRILSEKPADDIMYLICWEIKGKRNRYSKQLSRLLIKWQQNLVSTHFRREVKLHEEITNLKMQVAELKDSRSWRITAPLRWIGALFRPRSG